MMSLEVSAELLELTDLRTVVSVVAMRCLAAAIKPSIAEASGVVSFSNRLELNYMLQVADGMLPSNQALRAMLACATREQELALVGLGAKEPTQLRALLEEEGFSFEQIASAGPGM